jgi:SAM-dependent methyltransferase
MRQSDDPPGRASGVTQHAKALWQSLRGALVPQGRVHRLAPRDAYRLWSESYDAQPDNVILALERELFGELLSGVSLTDKAVVDIGCGTGRHWRELFAGHPRMLHGVDSSPEMLERLRTRYPDAELHLRVGPRLDWFRNGTVDVLVSTLMLGHERDVEGELREWGRLLPHGGEIIVTDFHPDAFRAGMTRTFVHRGVTFEVEHHLHTPSTLRSLFQALHLEVVSFRERTLDSTVRAYFERKSSMKAFRKGFGTPLVLGFHLRRTE